MTKRQELNLIACAGAFLCIALGAYWGLSKMDTGCENWRDVMRAFGFIIGAGCCCAMIFVPEWIKWRKARKDSTYFTVRCAAIPQYVYESTADEHKKGETAAILSNKEGYTYERISTQAAEKGGSLLLARDILLARSAGGSIVPQSIKFADDSRAQKGQEQAKLSVITTAFDVAPDGRLHCSIAISGMRGEAKDIPVERVVSVFYDRDFSVSFKQLSEIC